MLSRPKNTQRKDAEDPIRLVKFKKRPIKHLIDIVVAVK